MYVCNCHVCGGGVRLGREGKARQGKGMHICVGEGSFNQMEGNLCMWEEGRFNQMEGNVCI